MLCHKNYRIDRYKLEHDTLISYPIYIILLFTASYTYSCNTFFHKILFTDMGYGLISIQFNDLGRCCFYLNG